jgi:hypothetical protein
MPYIRKEKREKFFPPNEPGITIVEPEQMEHPGDLNFLITMLCKHWFTTHGANYQAINDVLGALEGAKLEFYRRVAAPYEDQKIKENGDVYIATLNGGGKALSDYTDAEIANESYRRQMLALGDQPTCVEVSHATAAP